MMHFKPHIQKMSRYQTSLGRDLDHGIRLDRNEKVSPFSEELMKKVWGIFKNYSLSASPEAAGLYQTIAEYLQVEKNQIYISNGITEGIRFLYDLCTVPNDNVICLDPTYPMYKIYAEMYQVEYRKFTYNPNTLKPDLKTLTSQIDSKTKFVFIPNPNLPVESCFSINEIEEMAEICKKNGTYLVVDEAYYYFGSPAALDLIKKFDNFILFRTFSKAYGLAGLRIGYMVSNARFIEYISKSRSIVESNSLSMQIAEYFLKNPEIRNQHVKEVKEGQNWIRSELERMGLKWHGGEYTNGLLIFLKSKKAAEEAVAHFKEKKIYIRGAFEAPYESTIRISIGGVPYMKAFLKEFEDWHKKV